VVGAAGGATALANTGADDPAPPAASSDDTVSLDLEEGTVQVAVDDEMADEVDATNDSPDTESVNTPPGVETPASPQSADSPANDTHDAVNDDRDDHSVDADDESEDGDHEGEDGPDHPDEGNDDESTDTGEGDD
jgi:hypothetical protein